MDDSTVHVFPSSDLFSGRCHCKCRLSLPVHTDQKCKCHVQDTYHTVKKSKETKIAKHPPRFLIYGAKMIDKVVAASKKILALCLF